VNPSPDPRLAEIRDLTDRYKAGNQRSFKAVQDLFQLLLAATVMRAGGGVMLVSSTENPQTKNLVGRGGYLVPILLNDDRYLRVAATLCLRDGRLRITKASYQYQLHPDTTECGEIFRYDYAREPGPDPHPQGHLNVHGVLDQTGVMPASRPLNRVHFPTGRVSLEAVIRCLIEQFGVPTNEEPGRWRPLFAEAERAFLEIAHQPVSGPNQ
jgi:hypothetical protein